LNASNSYKCVLELEGLKIQIPPVATIEHLARKYKQKLYEKFIND